jgi:ATP-dependent NAD(P)H-hydrate dehydratase
MHRAVLDRLLPVLDWCRHKGQAGRVLVVGGSARYSGAPYFAAMAALRGGADLVTVLCPAEAALPIKCYSPDLMVHGALDGPEQDWVGHVDRADAVVLGCGLGLDNPAALRAACAVAERVRAAADKVLVIDGDAITYFARERTDLLMGNHRVVLTPNAMEFRRLWNACMPEHLPTPPFDAFEQPTEEISTIQGTTSPNVQDTVDLANQLGNVTLVRKGAVDVITNGRASVLIGKSSSPRRVGGQGDILAGLIGLCCSWLNAKNFDYEAISAISLASLWTRQASSETYKEFGRSMLASYILNKIGSSLENALSTCIRDSGKD